MSEFELQQLQDFQHLGYQLQLFLDQLVVNLELLFHFLGSLMHLWLQLELELLLILVLLVQCCKLELLN